MASTIIRACRRAHVIIFSPIYRYVTARCCDDPTHLTNSEDKLFPARVSNSLREIHHLLRSLVWHKHWRHVKVCNPAVYMGIWPDTSLTPEEEEARIPEMLRRWGKDPVHPTAEAYANLAETILNKAAAAQPTVPAVAAVSRKRHASPDATPDSRPLWVRHNSSEVVASHYGGRDGRAGPRGNAGRLDPRDNPGHPSGNAGARGQQHSMGRPGGNAGARGSWTGPSSGRDGGGGPSGNAGRCLPSYNRYKSGR